MNFESIINEKVLGAVPLGGGDIGKSYRVTTSSGVYFIKYYNISGMPGKEAHGLKAMAETKTVRVPEVIIYDDHFLVLELIKSASRCSDFQSCLGRELACMHKNTYRQFGFCEDNYIGTIRQKNNYSNNWIDFYIENRLEYQIKLAADRELSESWSRLKPLVPDIIGSSKEDPGLIHGDLWGGNVMTGPDGEPVLIDPAVYYGHREAELGMTMLFGGFSSEFYRAYNEEYPLEKRWKERINIYILYHVLNHFNLFGGGYRSQSVSLMRGYL